MLAKGNRSKQVTDACAKYGGFYLGSIGGPAARLAQDCIKQVEVLEYPELGMEAIWKIEVEDFPAFIVVDDKGNDFFAEVTKPVLTIGRALGFQCRRTTPQGLVWGLCLIPVATAAHRPSASCAWRDGNSGKAPSTGGSIVRPERADLE